MNRVEYHTVILAALLHDIGKFLQRGSRDLDIRGTHPEVSGRFVSGFREFFSGCVDFEKLLALTQRHHESLRFPDHTRADKAPDELKALAYIVSRADNYASSERGETSPSHQDFRSTPLVSVFGRLKIFTDRDPPKPMRYRAGTLAPERAFPQQFEAFEAGEMDSHLLEFGAEFKRLTTSLESTDFDVLYSHVLSLFNRYLWCVPSNTQEEVPDISLFDHLKVTSAIAACLYQFHSDNLDVQSIKNDTAEKFLLVVGDVAGIQNFIFDIAHVGVGAAAKRLRARSFRVGLVSDIAAHRIIQRFELPVSNILMSAGGKFYILLPKLAEAGAMLQKLADEFDEWCYRETNGEIKLHLARVPVSGKSFAGFDAILREATNALAASKLRPFHSMLANEVVWKADLFPMLHAQPGQDEKLCEVCRKVPGRKREEGRIECEGCFSDKDIGTKLPRARYLSYFSEKRPDAFEQLNRFCGLHRKAEEISGKPRMVASLHPAECTECGHMPFITEQLANYVPVAKENECIECGVAKHCHSKEQLSAGQPIFFQCIAAKATGRKALAYLKADVDNMGKLFAFGLKPDAAVTDEADGERSPYTLSRVLTLSRMLENFFSGWLQTELRERFPYLYTVYSGGDDLLIIGPWDHVIDFAAALNREFNRYVCGNPNITLSAGVALANPHTPVFSATRQADHLLEESKNAGRNRLTVFGATMEWGQVPAILGQARQLAEWMRGGVVPVSFGHRLLRYSTFHRRYKETHDSEYLRFLPMLKYDIARNLSRPAQREVRLWAETLKDLASPNLQHLRFSASYALNANRRGGQHDTR